MKVYSSLLKSTKTIFFWNYGDIFVPNIMIQNDPILTIFTKKTYFDQIDPINYIFDQTFIDKPDWNNFYKLLGKKFFDHFSQILAYEVILAPEICQNEPILTIFTKMTYFEQIEHINDIFYPISVHKPDWNNF